MGGYWRGTSIIGLRRFRGVGRRDRKEGEGRGAREAGDSVMVHVAESPVANGYALDVPTLGAQVRGQGAGERTTYGSYNKALNRMEQERKQNEKAKEAKHHFVVLPGFVAGGGERWERVRIAGVEGAYRLFVRGRNLVYEELVDRVGGSR